MNNKNTLLIVVAVVAIGSLFIMPRIMNRAPGVSTPPRVAETGLAPMVSYVESHYQTPEDYLVSTFTNHDIVFVGEFYKIAQNVNLIRNVIPLLYKAGVRNLGIEYALYADQARIDALLTAPAWSEQEARAITFDWVVTWGYKEYQDLFRAAWQLNSTLPKGAKPFRIVGLSVLQNWENVKTQSDMTNVEVIKQIISAGIPDAYIAQTVMKEFVDKGEKALVYVGQMHAFTAYRDEGYAKNAAAQGFSETRRAGTIVFDKIGARAATVLLHAPWPDSGSRSQLGYPVGGDLDALMLALPPDKRSVGFDTKGSPMGDLKETAAPFSTGHTDLTLSGMCDGYILQGPISDLTAVTQIPDFINDANAAQAAKNFPGPKPPQSDPATLNQIITEDISQVTTYLRLFK